MPKLNPEISNLFPNIDSHVYDDDFGCQVQPSGRFCLAIFEISPKESSLYPKSPVRNCDSCPILTQLF